MNDEIKIEDTVKDKVTGFKGVVVGVSEWLNGCKRAVIQPIKLKDGVPAEAQHIDFEQLEIVKRGPRHAKETPARRTGGPFPAMKRGGVALALLVCVAMTSCAPNYSNGSRIGTVTKLSEKGIFFKSWEGELNMGGLRSKTFHDKDGNSVGTAMVANVFEFNADPSQVEKLKAAMRSGERVELVYHQWLICPIDICDGHVVTEVKPAD